MYYCYCYFFKSCRHERTIFFLDRTFVELLQLLIFEINHAILQPKQNNCKLVFMYQNIFYILRKLNLKITFRSQIFVKPHMLPVQFWIGSIIIVIVNIFTSLYYKKCATIGVGSCILINCYIKYILNPTLIFFITKVWR